MLQGSHTRVPSMFVADLDNFFRIGRDDDPVEQRRRTNAPIDVTDHGQAGNVTERFPAESSGRKTRGNDSDRFHRRK
jgi:hypothetical protein